MLGWRKKANAVHLLAVPPSSERDQPVLEKLQSPRPRVVLAEALELAAVSSQARAEDDAAPAQPVERRDGVRENLHPSAGNRGDRRSQGDALGRECAGCEEDRRVGGRLPPDEGQVVPDEEAVPPGPLGLDRVVGDPFDVAVGAEVGDVEPVAHSYKLCGSTSTTAVTPAFCIAADPAASRSAARAAS